MDAVGTPADANLPTAGFEQTAKRSGEMGPRYQPLVVVMFAIAAGMVLDRYGQPHFFQLAVDAIGEHNCFAMWWCACAAFLATWWLAWHRRRDAFAAWLLLVAVAFLGSAWHHLNWRLFGCEEIARFATYAPAPACIEAVVRESPQRVSAPPPTPLRAIPGTEQSRCHIEITGIRDGTSWRPASGSCQLSVQGHLLDVQPGDKLRIFGQLARPAPPLNPGEFDFAAHARADRQLARLRNSAPECVVTREAGGRWNPRLWLDAIRTRTKQLVHSLIGPSRGDLAAAILLGAREGLPFEETEPYLVTGTIHVLVVSGMNVAILAAGLVALIRMGWLSRRAGLMLIMAVIVGYALLAGAQPPVVRAAVLGVLMCAAAWSGRRGVAFNSLFAAAIVVLAINPNDLFRAGPQLSFLAVAVLIWIGSWSLSRKAGPRDPLDQLIAAARPWYRRMFSGLGRGIIWLYVTSIAVWLTTLPLVLNRFHVASPIAVLISPAIWLVVIVAMWSGFIMLLTGWWLPSIGAVCAVVCNASLAGLELVVGWAESVPGGHVWAPGPAWWWVLVFYFGLLLVMIWGRRIAPPRWQLAAMAAWILVGLVPPTVRALSRDGLDCSFVAVGHGACVVLQGPNGETLLYDAGAIGSPEYATQTIASYLWHRGIMRIDGLVISHADIDHYNAVPGLLERFRVGAVYVSPVMFKSIEDVNQRGGVSVLRDAIARAGVPIREIWSGDRLQIGSGVSLHLLHPPRAGVVGSDNANSITLAVEYLGRRMLLPGDLEPPGLEDVMAESPYDCDVLLAPHHGSRHSDPPGFASWSKPEWVVISGGGDKIDPVVRTFERAGAGVFVTNDVGTIQCSIGTDAALRVATWHEPPRAAATAADAGP